MCELRDYCFRAGKVGKYRSLKVSVFRAFIDKAKEQRRIWRYRRLCAKRRIICEGSIGTMKCYGGLGRARGIGKESMAVQAIMAGAVHNLIKALRFIANSQSAARSNVRLAIAVFMLD